MTSSERDSRSAHILRGCIGIVGVIAIAAALFADALGIGSPDSFGRGQVLLLFWGLGLFFGGLLGPKIVSLYRGSAYFVLNALLLLAAVELGAIFLPKIVSFVSTDRVDQPKSPYLDLTYYAKQDWAADYWTEQQATTMHYRPFVVWRNQQFQGRTITIGSEGIRYTPGADCSEASYRAFVFGGSAMWGFGAPDWGTIPAYLQERLADSAESPVCIVNYSELAYVSTQGVLSLITKLQSGSVPDLVVFYDGFNDTYAAYRSGESGTHLQFAAIAQRFDAGSQNAFWEMMGELNLVKLIQGWGYQLSPSAGVSLENYQTMGIDGTSLADSVVRAYMTNYSTVEALAKAYGFESIMFWQPHISVGRKAFTSDEQTIRSGMDPALVRLLGQVYQIADAESDGRSSLYSLVHIFDESLGEIWIDDFGHTNPLGNQVVADRIANIILQVSDLK